MDQLQKSLDLLGSYPTWVKIAILVLVVAILALLLFGHPKSPSSPWKVRVFHFRDLTYNQERHLGELFPNLILDRLLRFELDASVSKAVEVAPTRGGEPETFWSEEVYKLAPLIAVGGSVEDGDDPQHFTARVTVASMDRTRHLRTLLEERVSVPITHSGMDRAANDLALLIQRSIEQLPF